ncbi:MAG: LPS O-antigen subunit length determinant protein (WzzB/FepE family), partial [Patiriisocius sp.]
MNTTPGAAPGSRFFVLALGLLVGFVIGFVMLLSR